MLICNRITRPNSLSKLEDILCERQHKVNRCKRFTLDQAANVAVA